jgi:hypothetical protein
VKKPKLDADQVTRWLSDLSDQQFIALFYAQLSGRNIYRAERRHCDSKLVLANAKRHREDDGTTGPWQLEVLCPTPGANWSADAPVCQFGHCCGHPTASVARLSQCPICSLGVSGT